MIRAMVGLFSKRCPHCKSIEFRRVGARNATEKAFHWLLQPFRCGLCDRHFYMARWQAPLRETA